MCCALSCALSCILRCLLSIVTSLMMTIGIVLLVIGALLLWGFSLVMKGIYGIEAQITNFLKQFGVNNNGQEVMALMANNASVIGSIALAIGSVLIVISLMMIVAMCCCSVRLILIVIVIFICALTFTLIVLVAYYGSNPSDRILIPLQNYMQTQVINKYIGISAINAESVIVNVIQITVNCCGLYNYTDFNSATSFNRTLSLSNNTVINMTLPISCCDFNTDFTISDENNRKCMNTQRSSKMNNGCWSLIQAPLKYYLSCSITTLGITIGVLLAVITVLIVFIICMGKTP